MKVLFISPDSKEVSIGGVERYFNNLVTYCSQKSLPASFLLPARSGTKEETTHTVSLVSSDCLFLEYQKKEGEFTVDSAELEKKIEIFSSLLENLYKKETIDVVDAHNFHMLPVEYAKALDEFCLAKKIPAVLSLHLFAKKDIQKHIVSSYHWEKILCVSKKVALDCIDSGIEKEKIDVQYLGVNTNEFNDSLDKLWLKKRLGISENAKIILSASRITTGKRDLLKEKGIVGLVEAFGELPSKGNIYLVLAVSSPPENYKEQFKQAMEKLENTIREHNLEGKVVIEKFSMDEMPLVYNGADLFVLASENETFGQVFIEAMASGTPVIGTNVGGIPEIIEDNSNGFLIELNNPHVLSQKIDELLHNEDTRRKFIENGKKLIEQKFSMYVQFGKLFEYIKKLKTK